MEIALLLRRLAPLAFLLFCFAATVSEAARHGFFYTRSRGRCTPQYWSSRREEWPRMVPQTSTVVKVFGSMTHESFRADLTLVESTERNDEGNAYGEVLRQGIAALLNSYSRHRFPYTPWEVKTLVIQSLVSEDAAARQAKKFSVANNACE